MHKGDLYGTDRFSPCPAGRPEHRDHRDRSNVRSIPYLPRVVRPGWRQALSDPGEGIRYRLVQKPAQVPDHPPGGPWKDAHIVGATLAVNTFHLSPKRREDNKRRSLSDILKYEHKPGSERN